MIQKVVLKQKDIKKSIGHERFKYSYNFRRSDKSIGFVEIPREFGTELAENCYIDLTQSEKDIGTLDGTELAWKSVLKEDIELNSNGAKDNYEKRLKEKIEESANPRACREYAGILDTQNVK